jgi:hypothetical protein
MSFMHRYFQGVEYSQQAKLDAPFWAWHNAIIERTSAIISQGWALCLHEREGYGDSVEGDRVSP